MRRMHERHDGEAAMDAMNPDHAPHASNRSTRLDSTRRSTMHRYQPGTPRAIIGVAAVALTVATLAVAVLAPAAMNYGTREIGVLATTSDHVARSGDAATTQSIDVVAVRGVRLVPVAQLRPAAPKPGLQG
jgi:hypothetical protein